MAATKQVLRYRQVSMLFTAGSAKPSVLATEQKSKFGRRGLRQEAPQKCHMPTGFEHLRTSGMSVRQLLSGPNPYTHLKNVTGSEDP